MTSRGIEFCEKDIICSEYVYSGDAKIHLKLDYRNPALGLLLINHNMSPSKQLNVGYFIRFDDRSIQVYHKKYDTVQVIYASTTSVKPSIDSLQLSVHKEGNGLFIYQNETDVVAKIPLPEPIDSFRIGIYSDAKNRVQSMSVWARCPGGWMLNMRNTIGGHVQFFRDGLTFSNCTRQAEFEQSRIYLPKGTYYFDYESSDDSDIVPYIFYGEDDRTNDVDKTILDGKSFTVDGNKEVNLKFKGTHGSIKNITIKENESDVYIPTQIIDSIFTGSYINVRRFSNIKSIDIVFSIDGMFSEKDSAISRVLKTSDDDIRFMDYPFDLNTQYSLSITNTNGKLALSINRALDKFCIIDEMLAIDPSNGAMLLHNIDGKISSFLITYLDDRIFDIILQNTEQLSLPSTINSPIIITNEQFIPLDLSSSYRVYQVDGIDYYRFTNWEREVFEPKSRIHLQKQVRAGNENIIVYGIRDKKLVNRKKLYRIDEQYDSIDYYTPSHNYTILSPQEMVVDNHSNSITIIDFSTYEEIVVDYLKENSYSINTSSDLQSYIINVVSATENFTVSYALSESYRKVDIIDEGYLAIKEGY